MTNQERIKTLKSLRNSDLYLTPAELEALNWAIKVCHKADSRKQGTKPKSYCSWTA